MKHTVKVTIILISLFLLTQVVGLATIKEYINVVETEDGKTVIQHADTIVGPQPELEEKNYSAIPIVIAILIGTGLVLLLIRFRLGNVWKIWFFFAVFMTLALSFDVYMARIYAIMLALVLAALKILKPNVFVHNITEIFIYTGITIIIIPYLNIISAFSLLVLISVYDMYAVWKSKHMVKLAEFQTNSRLFAGLMLHYTPEKKKEKDKKQKKKDLTDEAHIKIKVEERKKSAILGGGDIAFPLVFTSVVMEHLILSNGLTKNTAFLQSSIVTLFATIALAILFWKSKKDKFYPAMPFISAGCIAGYIVILLIGLI